jgi:hypothetical protein
VDSLPTLKVALVLFVLGVANFLTRYLIPKDWIDERQIPLGISGAFLFASVVVGITGLILAVLNR